MSTSGTNNELPQSSKDLFFDPEKYPDNTLKAFTEYAQIFKLRYVAQFPDPPKVSLDAALARWKVEHITEQQQNPTPNLAQYDAVVSTWKAKDMVAKFLGMFSSHRLYTDWIVAQPNEEVRKTIQ